MNKQVDEMAEYLFKDPMVYDTYCREGCRYISIILHEAGYRKQNEVATEIISEIEQAIFAHGTNYAMKRIAELKKKYEVQEEI